MSTAIIWFQMIHCGGEQNGPKREIEQADLVVRDVEPRALIIYWVGLEAQHVAEVLGEFDRIDPDIGPGLDYCPVAASMAEEPWDSRADFGEDGSAPPEVLLGPPEAVEADNVSSF